MLLPNGTVIDGKFQVRGTIGSGGMGVVYEAYQAAFERMVALKLLTYAPSDKDTDVARFEREAQVLSRLTHPNIVRFYSYGVWRGYPYIAMERLHGANLQKLIAEFENGLRVDVALPIVMQIVSALEHAHEQGVFHRDVKPSNVILTRLSPDTYEVKLIDFGLAKLTGIDGKQKLTQTGQALGSVMYMSPEQCLGTPVDGRTDIYGVGCLLFHCLTGQPPFNAENGVAMMFQHLNEPVMNSDGWSRLTPPMKQIIGRCLAKQVQHRYAGAAELQADLQRIAAGEGDQIRYAPHVESLAPPASQNAASRRTPALLVVALLLGVLLIGVAATLATQHLRNAATTTSGANLPDDSRESAEDEAASISNPEIAFLRGNRFLQEHDWQRALVLLLRANQLLDDENKGKSSSKSKTNIRTAFQIKSTLASTYFALANMDAAYPLALQAVDISKGLSKTNHGGALDLVCAILLTQKKEPEALDYARRAAHAFDEAIAEYGPGASSAAWRNAAHGWLRVAECCEYLGKYKDAESAAQNAVRQSLESADPNVRLRSLRMLARAKYSQGQITPAFRVMQQWLQAEAGMAEISLPWAEMAYGHQFLAVIRRRLGDVAAAKKDSDDSIGYASNVKSGSDSDFAGGKYTEQAVLFYRLKQIDAGDEARENANALLTRGTDNKMKEVYRTAMADERARALSTLHAK